MGNSNLPEIGDLVFTVIIGYIGALELIYVLRHLYHWTCQHAELTETEHNDNIENLKSQLALSEAATEKAGGKSVMKDGVSYVDGFRVDPQQHGNSRRRKELENELAKQKQIEEETRHKLKEAEAKLEEQRRAAEEEKLFAIEREHERKQRQLEEEERAAREQAAKMLAIEREHEIKQRQLEEDEQAEQEQAAKMLSIEREREMKHRQLEEEEKHHEGAAQKPGENDDMERDRRETELQFDEMLSTERELEMKQQQDDKEEERQLVTHKTIDNNKSQEPNSGQHDQFEDIDNNKTINEEANKTTTNKFENQNKDEKDYDENMERLLNTELEMEEKQRVIEEEEDRKAADIVFKLLEAERERELAEQLAERERKLKLIAENARKFLEAEQEMVELQEHMTQAARAPIVEEVMEAVEEPCIRKQMVPHYNQGEDLPVLQKVKTQFGQGNESYSVPSNVRHSPEQDFENKTNTYAEISTEEEEEKSIENTILTDDYLRSLDGIKPKALVREDGSGRRRAFKVRRSSGSSNSSRDSRTSRDEELKMFTSLEEEEMAKTNISDNEFVPIKYTNEQNLKVKGHHRRHKRSPAKDSKSSNDNSQVGSLEMLGEEENTNPWGEGKPESYKNTEFWKREKAMSIDEETIQLHKPENTEQENNTSTMAKTSSFEEANAIQNEEALQKLSLPNNGDEQTEAIEENVKWETKVNLQSSNLEELNASTSRSRSSGSPRLRRSPRIGEMDTYEDRWQKTQDSQSLEFKHNPSITVRQPSLDNAPWRDEHGLLMQGLSDFYDFQASVNPSRSRSTSRNSSPISTPQLNNFNKKSGANDVMYNNYEDTDMRS